MRTLFCAGRSVCPTALDHFFSNSAFGKQFLAQNSEDNAKHD
jgi:hypothetical protein